MSSIGPYLQQTPETQLAILRCAEHGAATSGTLTDLVYARAKRARSGNPNFADAGSRIAYNSARKRVARLVSANFLERATFVFARAPQHTVIANYANVDLAPFTKPPGELRHGYVRSVVAADLVQRDYSVGRDPPLVSLFFGPDRGVGSYRCRACDRPGKHEPRACTAGAQFCKMAPVFESEHSKVTVDWDLAFKLDSAQRFIRCVVWVDDGTSLSAQFAALLPLFAECARTAPLRELRVIIRPDDTSVYSAKAKSWLTRGERLGRMLELLAKAGVTATAGGHAGHQHLRE
jgi:hypothetical protein